MGRTRGSQAGRVPALGKAAPGLLAIAIGLRLAISFLPCEAWGPSGYLCAAGYLELPLGRPHTCVANAAIPEGARLSNRLDYLSFRRERFTVDELGYRNGPEAKPARPRVVLLGSSFSMGLALNDEDTFSARLNRRLGPVVYNAASPLDPRLLADDMVRAARRIRLERGIILLEIINRMPFTLRPAPLHGLAPAAAEPAIVRLERRRRDVSDAVTRRLAPVLSLERQVEHAPALIRLSTLLNMRLHDGRILPNPFFGQYVEEELANGRRVLMFAGDKEFSLRPADPGITTNTLLQINGELDQHGLRLAVLLLPNAYSVYSPLLRGRREADASESYMDEMARRLTASGVPAMNLLPPMRAAAADALRQNRLIYYPDDAHWNAAGSDVAAEVAAPWLAALMGGAGGRH